MFSDRSGAVLAGVLVAMFAALALQGCGGIAAVSTTTTTTTAVMAGNTTTTTTTTVTDLGGCRAEIMDEERANDAMWCFCFYGGGCQSHFQCYNGTHHEPLDWCQKRHCGESPIMTTDATTSVFDLHHENNVLTVPKHFYNNVLTLHQQCEDGGAASLAELLGAGRRAFLNASVGGNGVSPEWQCLHLPRYVGVHWLHVHTFIGKVGGEKLPNVPPEAICAKASLHPNVAAKQLIELIPKEINSLDVQV